MEFRNHERPAARRRADEFRRGADEFDGRRHRRRRGGESGAGGDERVAGEVADVVRRDSINSALRETVHEERDHIRQRPDDGADNGAAGDGEARGAQVHRFVERKDHLRGRDWRGGALEDGRREIIHCERRRIRGQAAVRIVDDAAELRVVIGQGHRIERVAGARGPGDVRAVLLPAVSRAAGVTERHRERRAAAFVHIQARRMRADERQGAGDVLHIEERECRARLRRAGLISEAHARVGKARRVVDRHAGNLLPGVAGIHFAVEVMDIRRAGFPDDRAQEDPVHRRGHVDGGIRVIVAQPLEPHRTVIRVPHIQPEGDIRARAIRPAVKREAGDLRARRGVIDPHLRLHRPHAAIPQPGGNRRPCDGRIVPRAPQVRVPRCGEIQFVVRGIEDHIPQRGVGNIQEHRRGERGFVEGGNDSRRRSSDEERGKEQEGAFHGGGNIGRIMHRADEFWNSRNHRDDGAAHGRSRCTSSARPASTSSTFTVRAVRVRGTSPGRK